LTTPPAAIAISAIGCVAGVGLSLPLWYSADRLYPRVPVVAGLVMPPPMEGAFVGCLVIALALVAAGWRRRVSVPAALAFTAILVAFDQSRLQPWVYEYALLFAALSAIVPGQPSHGRSPDVMATGRLIVIALYFWSGVQKMNVTFVSQIWPAVAAPLMAVGPGAALLGGLGWGVPVAEVAIAWGLLARRTRRYAVVIAVCLHAGILITLTLAGENRVVWPWNVALALLVTALFGGGAGAEGRTSIVTGDGSPRHRLAIAACVVLPVFSFAGWWDPYLSGALYSGNTLQAAIVVTPEVAERLPAVMKQSTWRQSRPMFLDLNRWSYAELQVPAYPAYRVLRAVAEQVCAAYVPRGHGSIRLLGRPHWRTGERRLESHDCSGQAP
jgi:hypothetical protein